jgi:hypothetical protein
MNTLVIATEAQQSRSHAKDLSVKARSSFLKKRTKKLLFRFAPCWPAMVPTPREADQEFFASFFAKKEVLSPS